MLNKLDQNTTQKSQARNVRKTCEKYSHHSKSTSCRKLKLADACNGQYQDIDVEDEAASGDIHRHGDMDLTLD